MRWSLILSTMRWSLILSTFIAAQSALSFAAVIPSSDQLQRRGPAGAKVSSKTYRKNAEDHAYAYKFDKAGGVTREWLETSERLRNNQKMLKIPKTDADHVFEHQMLNKHLEFHGIEWKRLGSPLQKKVTAIINGPGNMAPVPAGVNRGKGQVVKHGMDGKAIAPKKDRDEYTRISYRTARKTAKQLDRAFWKAKYPNVNFQGTLRQTMINAKIIQPHDPSPASSRAASSRASSPGSNAASTKGTPKRPARVNPVGKPSPPKAPARTPPKTPARTPPKAPARNSGTQGTPKRPARVYSVGKSSPQKETVRESARIAAMPPKSYKGM